MKRKIIIFVILLLVFAAGLFWLRRNPEKSGLSSVVELLVNQHPLAIEYMRKQEYPGSEIVIEQTLSAGSNYKRYLVSYQSEGLKIYGLLTVPNARKPETGSPRGEAGWPAIIFNHGYIPPAEYKTTERYAVYTDIFSRSGYIVFKPDYRGHGNSEGNPEGAYYSPAYTIDVLNAVTSIKKYQDADPNRIGMWGHSMGGNLTLRSMVVSKDIKAGVIWAGVVASYEDMMKNWTRSRPWMPSQREQAFRRPGRQELINKYGDFDKNPSFWNTISPIIYVQEISGPVQLHHGTADDDVPILFSEKLNEALKNAGKEAEFYTYPGDDHNLSSNLSTALRRSLDFFDKHVKGAKAI